MSATKSLVARPSADVLRDLYVTRGIGCPDIGRMFQRDPKTVFWWLRQAGIQTRARGSNPGPQFKKGDRGAFSGRRHSAASRQRIRASTVADGRVPYLRDGVHWLKGVPASLNPNWKGGITPDRQTFYRSREWKAVSVAVWTRANGCCERCGLDLRAVDRREVGTFHVHHIVAFAVRELRAEVTNLALLCRECHWFVHSAANVGHEYLKQADREMATPSLFDLEEAA